MKPSCRICRSNGTVPYGSAGDKRFFYCPECEYISRNENLLLSHTAEKETYDRHNNSIDDPTHVSFYTPKTLEYVADAAGLKIIHTDNVRYTTFKLKDR